MLHCGLTKRRVHMCGALQRTTACRSARLPSHLMSIYIASRRQTGKLRERAQAWWVIAVAGSDGIHNPSECQRPEQTP